MRRLSMFHFHQASLCSGSLFEGPYLVTAGSLCWTCVLLQGLQVADRSDPVARHHLDSQVSETGRPSRRSCLARASQQPPICASNERVHQKSRLPPTAGSQYLCSASRNLTKQIGRPTKIDRRTQQANPSGHLVQCGREHRKCCQ